MRDGNKTSVITDFKYEIIKRMYETPEIIEILDCDQVDPEQPDTAEWNCIFPYIKIPGVQEKVENFGPKKGYFRELKISFSMRETQCRAYRSPEAELLAGLWLYYNYHPATKNPPRGE